MLKAEHRCRFARLLGQLNPALAAARSRRPPSGTSDRGLPDDPYPQMSDADKFRFDTQGFITIKGVLSAEELRLLNAAFDENQHLSEDDENHGPLQRDGHNERMQIFHEETKRRQVAAAALPPVSLTFSHTKR